MHGDKLGLDSLIDNLHLPQLALTGVQFCSDSQGNFSIILLSCSVSHFRFPVISFLLQGRFVRTYESQPPVRPPVGDTILAGIR